MSKILSMRKLTIGRSFSIISNVVFKSRCSNILELHGSLPVDKRGLSIWVKKTFLKNLFLDFSRKRICSFKFFLSRLKTLVHLDFTSQAQDTATGKVMLTAATDKDHATTKLMFQFSCNHFHATKLSLPLYMSLKVKVLFCTVTLLYWIRLYSNED